jgi:hypothetical protein
LPITRYSHLIDFQCDEDLFVERLTFDDLAVAEAWLANRGKGDEPAVEILSNALSHLRNLMGQDLSRSDLVKYLRQQMGIEPKSEKLKESPPANQFPGSAIFRR